MNHIPYLLKNPSDDEQDNDKENLDFIDGEYIVNNTKVTIIEKTKETLPEDTQENSEE